MSPLAADDVKREQPEREESWGTFLEGGSR